MRRISIRRLMVFIAIVALASAIAITFKRSREYRVLAELNAALEAENIALTNMGKAAGDSHRVATGNLFATYYRSLKGKYEQAARYPWSQPEPDPPKPHPPASAILKGTPR
jgi:hypothetical protein